ncbi:MAG: hypothetical protein WAT47_08155 [Nostocoides sp.]
MATADELAGAHRWVQRQRAFGYYMRFRAAVIGSIARRDDPVWEDPIIRDADLMCAVTMLRNVVRSARLMAVLTESEHAKAQLNAALGQFSLALPGLNEMRNVLEHFDDYLLGNGRMQQRHGSPTFPVWLHVPHQGHQWDLRIGEHTLSLNDVEPAMEPLTHAVHHASMGLPDLDVLEELGIITTDSDR